MPANYVQAESKAKLPARHCKELAQQPQVQLPHVIRVHTVTIKLKLHCTLSLSHFRSLALHVWRLVSVTVSASVYSFV